MVHANPHNVNILHVLTLRLHTLQRRVQYQNSWQHFGNDNALDSGMPLVIMPMMLVRINNALPGFNIHQLQKIYIPVETRTNIIIVSLALHCLNEFHFHYMSFKFLLHFIYLCCCKIELIYNINWLIFCTSHRSMHAFLKAHVKSSTHSPYFWYRCLIRHTRQAMSGTYYDGDDDDCSESRRARLTHIFNNKSPVLIFKLGSFLVPKQSYGNLNIFWNRPHDQSSVRIFKCWLPCMQL